MLSIHVVSHSFDDKTIQKNCTGNKLKSVDKIQVTILTHIFHTYSVSNFTHDTVLSEQSYKVSIYERLSHFWSFYGHFIIKLIEISCKTYCFWPTKNVSIPFIFYLNFCYLSKSRLDALDCFSTFIVGVVVVVIIIIIFAVASATDECTATQMLSYRICMWKFYKLLCSV